MRIWLAVASPGVAPFFKDMVTLTWFSSLCGDTDWLYQRANDADNDSSLVKS